MVKANQLLLRMAAIAMLLLTSSCSLKLKVTLFNDSGRRLVVHSESGEIPLNESASATFFYPGTSQRWMLRLSTPQCEYAYQVPSSLEHYPVSSGTREPLKAQVEPDLSIYLLPPAASGVGVITEYGALQNDGFPLRPVSSSCL